jgi:hypothetical protein
MRSIRIILIAVQVVVMINAFGGGYYGLSGAPGVDPAWLEGSPFHSYLVPGLFLFAVVGGGMALATVAWVKRSPSAPLLSVGMGALLVSWIVVQVAIIGYVSWLQPASFVAGLVLIGLGWLALRGERSRRLAGVAD